MKYGIAIYLSAALGSMVLGGAAAAQDAEEGGEALETVQEIAEDAAEAVEQDIPPPRMIAIPPQGAPAMANPATPRPKVLVANSGIQPADYPAEAWRRNEEGSVGYELTYDGAATITGCEIVDSSGSESLDAATCPILYKRARLAFNDDMARAGGTVRGQHNWYKREPEFDTFKLVVAFTVDKDGTPSNCEVLAAEGKLPSGMRDSMERGPCLSAGRGIPFRNEMGEPVARRLLMTLNVEDIPLETE